MIASLNDPDVARFFAHSMVVQVATLSAKGNPFVTPLWFVVDRGRLYITTGRRSAVVRNIGQRPQVVLLFTAERLGASGRALRVRGSAQCHEGFPPLRVLLPIASKYYVAPRGLLTELRNAGKWGLRNRYYAQGGPAFIEVTPESVEFLAVPVS